MAPMTLSLLLWASTSAYGQNTPPTTGVPTSGVPTNGVPTHDDNDTKSWQIANMDRFLDSHPEIEEQLRKDPSLIRNDEFVEKHPALQQYLQEHPGIREEFTENPNAFMRQEQRYERREDFDGRDRDRNGDRDITREQLANMDRFMDTHPEIAEQLRKDPSLIKNKEFVENHPALQEFLQTHPQVREEFRENPNAFMRREERFDRREGDRDDRRIGGDRDVTREELAATDRFMDTHPEIAEQLHKDPSLIKNKEFVESHPALHEFLQTHPEVREEFRENPNGFMRQEGRFERREDSRDRGTALQDRDRTSFHDRDRDDLSSFGQFLGGHSTLAQQLSKDPSLANNKEFLANHAELQDYLKTHPEVQKQLATNPQSVIPPATQTPSAVVDPKLEPKHKQ
jgi:YHS domain-containing protein